MKTGIRHAIKLYAQTPEAMCGPTSLAMQLSAQGEELSPDEVVTQASRFKRAGDPGFTSQELASYCLSLGYQVELWSFDGLVLDYAWKELEGAALAAELEKLCRHHEARTPVEEMKLRYALSYLAFVKAGGSLHVAPFVTTELLLRLLEKGPVGVAVLFGVFASEGKRDADQAFNALTGGSSTHSVLIFGHDEATGFLVADPTPGRGTVTVSKENLLAAITAAQVEYDNVIFQVTGARAS
jgi:hypothetical protein